MRKTIGKSETNINIDISNEMTLALPGLNVVINWK